MLINEVTFSKQEHNSLLVLEDLKEHLGEILKQHTSNNIFTQKRPVGRNNLVNIFEISDSF